MKKYLWFPIVLGIATVVGCGSSSDPTKNEDPSNVTASNTVTDKPVNSKVQLPSEPKDVVRLFLDSMRQGNGDQLSALLSTAARAEIQRKKLEIDPIGSPAASFQIVDAAPKDDGYLVSTTWSEPESNGQPASEIEVVFELRKENVGWRICGMAADSQTGDEIQVVNFENLEPAAPEPRVASVPAIPASSTGPAPGYTPVSHTLPTSPQGLPVQGAQSPQAANYPNSTSPNAVPEGNSQTKLPPVVSGAPQLPPIQPPTNFQQKPYNNGNLQQQPNGQPSYAPQNPVPQTSSNNGGFQLPPPR